MKAKFYAFLLGVTALFLFNTAGAFTGLTIIVKPTSNNPNPLALISAKQFLDLTPKKYEAMSGKKMSLFQKMEFKMLQHKVKKMVKRGEVVTMADVQKRFEDAGTMNILGFLLGLILGPVGVIIVLILKESGNASAEMLRWSLYGLLIWLAVVLIFILL